MLAFPVALSCLMIVRRVARRLTNVVRNIVRAIGTASRKSPWLVPVAILALFFVV